MPAELGEEEIEEIYEEWDSRDDPSYTGVADDLGLSRDTVSKYIKEREADEVEDGEDLEGVPSIETEAERESLFPDPGEEAAEAFTTFFEQLNKKFGLGIKEKAIDMMAGEVRDSGKLPQHNNVASFLDRADSGVKNSEEIRWIADRYRLWLEKYTQRRGPSAQPSMGGMSGPGAHSVGGESPGTMTGLTEGGVDAGGQPSMVGGMGQGVGGNPMMMMFQQMQQQIQRLEQKLEQSGDQSGSDILERKTQDYLEQKFEQLIQAESEAEQEAVVQELRALRRDMEQGGGRPPAELGEDWRTDLIELARTEQVSMSEAKEILESVGEVETDPRVLEKKYEKEIKEKELDHQSERYEKLGEIGETVASQLGTALGNAVVGRNGAGESEAASETEAEAGDRAAPDGGATASTPAPSAPSYPRRGDPCENCGETMIQTAGGAVCPSCQYMVMGCDNCSTPVEVPPIGGADRGGCPECGTVIEFDGDSTDLDCPACEWEGHTDDVAPEYVRCTSCDTDRPIDRFTGPQLNQLEEMVA